MLGAVCGIDYVGFQLLPSYMYLFIKISETYLISWWIMDDIDFTSYNSISVISGDTGFGWSGGAMVLGKPVIPGHPTNLGLSRARPTALAVGAGGGCLNSFPSSINSFLFLSLSGRRPDID